MDDGQRIHMVILNDRGIPQDDTYYGLTSLFGISWCTER